MDVDIEEFNSGPVSIRKSELGVYQPGTVDATFESVTGAGTQDFNGNDTQVVVARLEPNRSVDTSTEMIPNSVGEAEDLLTQENANENATFWVENAGTISSGSVSTSVDFPESGTYAVFLATGSAFDAPTNGGNLSIDETESTTIVGMDAAIVEESAADVSDAPSTVEPGTNATFTVNAGTDETNLSVLVYDTSTVVNSETVFRVTEPIDTSLNASDITIRHSIDTVNGVADFEGSVTMLDTTFNDDRVSGSTSVPGIIERAIDEANNQTDSSIDQPNTEVIDDGTTLDASAVGKANVSGSVTVNVETFENWSTGEYTWIIVTGGNDDGDIQTATGTLDVKEPEDDDGGDGFTPPSLPEDDDDDDDDEGEEPVTKPPEQTPVRGGAAPGSTVRKQNRGMSVNLTGTTPGDPVEFNVSVNGSEIERNGSFVTGATLNFTRNSSGSINFTQTDDPSGVPPVSRDGDLGYFEITHSMPNEDVDGATYQFAVSKQRIEQFGITADDVALFRFENNGWRELETRVVGETQTAYQFEADSPGLSKYAISQRGSAQADISVTDATLDSTQATVGDTVEVTATIENQGSAAGEFTASLQVDGTVVAEQTVELGAGEQTTVTFTRTFDEAGDYTISVSGTSAGALEVSAQETTTTTTTTTATTTTTTTTAPGTTATTTPGGGGGGISPLIWLAVLVILAAIAAVVYLYNQGYFEDEPESRI